MDFVDEQDGLRLGLESLQYRLETILEITPVAGSGEERSEIQPEYRGLFQSFRNPALGDLQGEAFRQGGLADPRIPHEDGIALPAPYQDVLGPLELPTPPDEGIDASVPSQRHQILRESRQGIRSGSFRPFAAFFRGFVPGGQGRGKGIHLGDPMSDVADDVQPADPLLLQEVHRKALRLVEHGDQHVVPVDFFLAGTIHMRRGPGDDPLKAQTGLGLDELFPGQGFDLFVQKALQNRRQALDIRAGVVQNLARLLFQGQSEEKVFQAGKLMPAAAGLRQGQGKGNL